MKAKMSIAFLIVALAVFFIPASLQAKGLNETPTITVQGSSQMEVSPDVAYIQLAVVTSASTVAEAQEENARLVSKVFKRLEEAGIAKDHIKTVQLNVTPLYQEDGKRTNIRGYQVTNTFSVTSVPERVGELIDIALEAGANSVDNVRFSKRDEAAVKNAVLQAAVKDALNKAEAISTALGTRIIRVQSVNEQGVYVQAQDTGMRYKANFAEKTPTPVSPGLLHVNATVSVVVEME